MDEIYNLYPATRKDGTSTEKSQAHKKKIADILTQGEDLLGLLKLSLRKTNPEHYKNLSNFLTALPDRGELEKADDWV